MIFGVRWRTATRAAVHRSARCFSSSFLASSRSSSSTTWLVFSRLEPIEQEVWKWLSERNRFGSMGRRVCCARYGAINHAAEQNRGLWSVHLWERTFVALESDFLNSRRHAALRLKDSVVADGEHGSTSSTKGLLLDDRVIRGAASNAVGISVMTLERRDHQRVVDVVCEISKPLTAFHTEQSREARSVNACDACFAC